MQATLAVTADIATLTLHDALPISGTEFTTGASQLKNGDTIDSVTLTSTGAAATAHRSSGDLAVGLFGITASAAVAHTGKIGRASCRERACKSATGAGRARTVQKV